MNGFSVVGKALPRVDSRSKATGETRYITDLSIPGMVYGKVLRSTHAHARIVRTDISEAERMPGVVAVVTGEDAPYTYGRMVQDEPFLAREVVRYIGEPVAAVAAVDEETAEAALDHIRVEYEPLPAVFDVEEALRPDAPLVHPDLGSYHKGPIPVPVPGTNTCSVFKIRKGDVEAGFAESDFVFEHRFTTPPIQHCYIEPCAAIAQMDPSGVLTVWSGTQGSHLLHQLLSASIGIPLDRVRVIQPPYGGGFGGKVPMHVEPIAVALALKCRRPVRVVLSREEEFSAATTRHASVVTIRSGVTRDGRVLARKVNAVLDTGAYARIGPLVLRNGSIAAGGPYDIPNVWIDGACVYTNKVPAGALRGFGTPQMTWAYESHTDMIAHELGIDPVEFRLKNVLREGGENATGEKVKYVAVERCIELAAKEIGWNGPRRTEPSGKARGRGIASTVKACAGPAQSVVVLRFSRSGRVKALVSASEMGQGLHTVVAHIVAEELGLKVDDVSVTYPDTDFTPFDELTTASKATFHTGNATRAAARDLREQIAAIAAEQLGVPAATLGFEAGLVRTADGGASVAMKDILGKGKYRAANELVGRGMFASDYVIPLDRETGLSEAPVAFWMYAAQAAEVEVDLETGDVKVLRMVAAHDVGQAISRLGCEQQIQGGVVFALGQSLWEQTMFRDGRVINPTLLDYKIFTSLDTPDIVPIIVEDAPHDFGPYGGKGLGEIVTTPTAAAIANAVFDATGVRITDLPLTPEKVRNALRAARQNTQAEYDKAEYDKDDIERREEGML
ncbi:MAG: xanthine dehydrogenase family protein molybdopterin-binding subunit [Bacillota bacterium]